jgi:hypothetical protein
LLRDDNRIRATTPCRAGGTWSHDPLAVEERLSFSPLNSVEVNLSEIRNRTKVRLIAGSKDSECCILDEPFLDLPRRKHPDAISVYQYLRHHLILEQTLRVAQSRKGRKFCCNAIGEIIAGADWILYNGRK